MIEITFVESDSGRQNKFLNYWKQYLAKTSLDAEVSFVSEADTTTPLFGEVLIIDLSFDGDRMFEVAETYRKYNPDGMIILLCDDNSYALKGYSISAYRYYLHPISEETFFTAMDEMTARLMIPNSYYVFIKTGDKLKKIYLKDIFSITENDNTLYYATKYGTYSTQASLEKVVRYYSRLNFFSLKKHVLVNLENIQAYQESASYASLKPALAH